MKIFNLRMMLASTVLAGAVMAPVSLWAAGYQKQGRCITLSLPAKPKQAKTVRLTIVSDNIIRVEATPEDAIPQKRKSLVVVNREGKYTADVKEDDRMVTVETAAIIAKVEKQTGKLTFIDKTTGKVLLQEADGSKTFTKYVSNQTELPANYHPTSPDEVNWGKKTDLNKLSLEDRSGYSWHALFESDADEAFYGLGQHQSEEMNYKGRN